MRIDESKIFEFRFPYYGGELTIPVRAQSREEAADALRGHINNWMTELAMEFPKAAPSRIDPTKDTGAPPQGAPEQPLPSAVPTYALELDIETLIKEIMPIKKPKGANSIGKLVKDWTGFEYSPENYAVIIEELKKLK